VAYTVTVTGGAGEDTRVDHTDADSVAIEEGHLVLRGHRAIVGIYAPGKWHSVVELKPTRLAGGRRAAVVSDVSA
jgi:hypothetical protein